jgi:hypothetical protein
MKRSWNLLIWIGFLLVLAAPFSYLFFFVRFPVTRDVPWAPLPIFGAGLVAIAIGMRRAFHDPALHRGRIAGPILMILGAGVCGLFVFGMFYEARQLPASSGAPRLGQAAPDFTLPDADGHDVTLSKLLEPEAGAAAVPRAVLLIFYRGYW